MVRKRRPLLDVTIDNLEILSPSAVNGGGGRNAFCRYFANAAHSLESLRAQLYCAVKKQIRNFHNYAAIIQILPS